MRVHDNSLVVACVATVLTWPNVILFFFLSQSSGLPFYCDVWHSSDSNIPTRLFFSSVSAFDLTPLFIYSHRPCSALCNPLSCSPAPESVFSIASLSCAGGKPPLSLVGSKSPFPFLTALLFLISSITHIHKGLSSKVRTDFFTVSSRWIMIYLWGRSIFVSFQA